MENQDNIVLVCKECIENTYPNKGKLTVDVGGFAKLEFVGKCASEYMWVKVTKVDREKGECEGLLDNDPILVKDIKCGDKVKFKMADILDVA